MKKINRTKINLFLDIALTLVFIVEMEEHFTGVRNHELLGLFFAAILIVHIILHLDWVVNITRTFFKKVFHESRFNYVLNLALFVDIVVATVTGIMISRTLGLNLGIQDNHQWETIHVIASHMSVILIGLHVGMHWKWIVNHAQKYIFSAFRLPQRRTPQVAAASQAPEQR